MLVGSLFCGAGGFDLGFIQAGHKVIWAIDNCPDCIQTYRNNIGQHAIESDVSEIQYNSLDQAELIIGGFPCQGFSMANKFRHKKDSRNELYLEFVRAVSEQKPKHFLAENVRGILSLDKGNAIKKITRDFESEGYRVETKLFNASHFGVPQNRQRVFIWGIREDISIDRIWPAPLTENKLVTVKEALKGIPEPAENSKLPNHIGSKYKLTGKNFVGCRPTDPNKPCPTIIARGDGKGGVNAIPHPNNNRRMTVREQAIMQTFPKNFEFFGSMSSTYRQVGNAVPVKLSKEFGKAFMSLK